jgi:hypothetical protein
MSLAWNGVLAIRVDLLTFTCTMHFPFLPTSGLGSLCSWCHFSSHLLSSYVVGFRILLRAPSRTVVLYGFVCCCSAGREGSRKGNREGQIEGEFPHTLLSTSLIISAFLCGSPPFEVYFIYVGLSQERSVKKEASRKKRQTWRSRSPFVIVPCGSVQALMLGFRYSKCWVSGLQLLMSGIWVFYVVISLLYKSRSRVGNFCMTGYCSFYSAFYGGKVGRSSSTRPKPIALLSSMTSDSEVENDTL